MARGKHAARAAIRRDAAETEAEITSLKHTVKRLTGELEETKQRLDAERRASAAEMRTARALMESNASPQLQEAHEEIKFLRNRIEELEEKDRYRLKAHERIIFHAMGALEASGFTHAEAVDIIGSNGSLVTVAREGIPNPGTTSAEQIRVLDRVRGARSAFDIHNNPDWRARFEEAVARNLQDAEYQ